MQTFQLSFEGAVAISGRESEGKLLSRISGSTTEVDEPNLEHE